MLSYLLTSQSQQR